MTAGREREAKKKKKKKKRRKMGKTGNRLVRRENAVGQEAGPGNPLISAAQLACCLVYTNSGRCPCALGAPVQ